jgi:pantoate--beta-alanine ligase
LRKLEHAGIDVVFLPTYEEIYPGAIPDPPNLGYLEDIMEGAFRPGHFKGVAIVVDRLFSLVRPDRAYFGLKDYQQFAVIRKLVAEKQIPVEVIGCPTTRDEKGLAMSSRNMRLTEEGRKSALLLIHSLEKAREKIKVEPVDRIKQEVIDLFESSGNCQLEYFEIADAESLTAVSDIRNNGSVIGCIAAYVEGVRLIDNLILIP